VTRLVAVTSGFGVSVRDPGSVDVSITVPLSVEEATGGRVSELEVAGGEAGERIQPITELPNVTTTTANRTSATENPSHWRPAVILAWRVR
jgi:hypothetical protein